MHKIEMCVRNTNVYVHIMGWLFPDLNLCIQMFCIGEFVNGTLVHTLVSISVLLTGQLISAFFYGVHRFYCPLQPDESV